VDVVWGYTPSSYDRTIAEEWIAANDCSFVDILAIGEASLAASVEAAPTRRAVTVRIKRHWDLGADLAEAINGLRLQL
jgi:hypothetical protein